MKKGFTLIELLIVVAIIAILAAIAVPNFLEAQTRAKVARGKADMRTVVTALETYKIDTNAYPSDAGNIAGSSFAITRAYPGNQPPANYSLGWELTTPIAYLSSIQSLTDPFRKGKEGKYLYGTPTYGRQFYNFTNHVLRAKANNNLAALVAKISIHGDYTLAAAGPDGFINNGAGGNDDYRYSGGTSPFPFGRNYDSTNGTVSIGDIYRSPKFNESGWERTDNL